MREEILAVIGRTSLREDVKKHGDVSEEWINTWTYEFELLVVFPQHNIIIEIYELFKKYFISYFDEFLK